MPLFYFKIPAKYRPVSGTRAFLSQDLVKFPPEFVYTKLNLIKIE